jgi:Fe-S-cluster-containing dehydrogenase component
LSRIVVFEQERCTYCHLCTLYCSLTFSKGGVVEARPSIARIRVAQNEDDTIYAAHVCFQCPVQEPGLPREAASCMVACPVEGCITRNPQTGIVEINEETCIGCAKCVRACEYQAVFLTDGKAVKCEVCEDPLCVKACAPKALTFAEPDDEYIKKIAQLYKEVRL